MDKFPSNSHKKRLPAEPKKGDKVIQGTAKIIPKNKTKTFLKNFLAEEIHELKKDIIAEIIVPQIKDAFMQSMRLMFYGEKENRSFGGNSNRTTYSKYFGEEQKKPSKNLGRGYELAYFSVETYNDATAILHALDEIIDEYGTASVAGQTVAVTRPQSWSFLNTTSASAEVFTANSPQCILDYFVIAGRKIPIADFLENNLQEFYDYPLMYDTSWNKVATPVNGANLRYLFYSDGSALYVERSCPNGALIQLGETVTKTADDVLKVVYNLETSAIYLP